ncbi:MAG: hypothetical protein IJ593_00830, partial [Lachnospiraceae bacterium]|nr:hypothetical protein [Lachnospiraceae bacterium]
SDGQPLKMSSRDFVATLNLSRDQIAEAAAENEIWKSGYMNQTVNVDNNDNEFSIGDFYSDDDYE